MKTLLIIILVLAVVAGAIFLATKYFKAFKDEDKDGIPDAVEDKVEDAKVVVREVKKRAKRVVEEAADVVDAVKEVAHQSKDIVSAVKGEPRKGRKPNTKK